ncbi:MAG: ABC transporter permease [Gemmatimonadaceae bacterium]
MSTGSQAAGERSWSSAAEATWRLCRTLVRLASLIVPRERRPVWRDEWAGELYYRILELDRAALLDAHVRRHLLVRTLGALPHALWVRQSEWRLDMLMQDLIFAARVSWKRPAFSLLVVATLGVGVGANSAMFSIVNAVIIRPLPFPRSDRLVYAFGSFKGSDRAAISPLDFLDYRAQTHALASFAGRTPFGTAVLSSGDDPERVTAPRVTANFFSTLGVRPLYGRTFLPDEEEGTHKVVVLSYGLWKRRFAADPRVVGTTTSIDGEPYTIAGVMPDMMSDIFPDQLWIPMPFHLPELSVRRYHMLRGIGRLRDGVSVAQAQAELDGIAKRLEATYPENASWHLRILRYQEVVVGDSGRILLILLGAVGLVLLVACANVASLMLARATSRQSEIAVRSALGASRSQIGRQLLTESVLLGAAAGVFGLLLAFALVDGVHSVAGDFLPRVAEVRVDGTAIAFTMAVAVLTGIMFGVAPALHAARRDLAASIRTLGRTTGGRHALQLRDTLVIGQIALSLVLLVGAGLLLRSLWLVEQVEPGFDPRGVLSAQIALPRDAFRSREDIQQFWTVFLDRVRALPGVEHAAATTMLPLAGGGDTYYYVDGHPPASDADKRTAQVNVSTEDYFATMRIPIVDGRALSMDDRSLGSDSLGHGTIVISQGMAKRLFPHGGAVGSRLVVDFGKPFRAEIVGVAGDVRAFGQDVESPDILYVSSGEVSAFRDGRFMSLVVRGARDGAQLTASVRAALRSISPRIPLADVASMNELLRSSLATSAFRSRLLGAFAAIALLLAVVGLYGVLAYTVTQRTREIGVRIALGARAQEVLGLIVGRGMRLVMIGIVLGSLGAVGAVRLIQGMLFQVSAFDPLVFALVVALLALGGFAACLIPARRATRISPMAALREE